MESRAGGANADKELVSKEDWRSARIDQAPEELRVVLQAVRGREVSSGVQRNLDGIPLKGFLDCLQDDRIIDSVFRAIDKFRYDVNSWS